MKGTQDTTWATAKQATGILTMTQMKMERITTIEITATIVATMAATGETHNITEPISEAEEEEETKYET